MDLRQCDLPEVGAQSVVSAVLAGKRARPGFLVASCNHENRGLSPIFRCSAGDRSCQEFHLVQFRSDVV